MAGIQPSDLVGGGAYRWVVRGVLFGSIALVLLLRYAFGMNIFLAVLVGFAVLLLELGVVWILLVRGKVKVKL